MIFISVYVNGNAASRKPTSSLNTADPKTQEDYVVTVVNPKTRPA